MGLPGSKPAPAQPGPPMRSLIGDQVAWEGQTPDGRAIKNSHFLQGLILATIFLVCLCGPPFLTPDLDLPALIPNYYLNPDSVVELLVCICSSQLLPCSCLTSALDHLALPPDLPWTLVPHSCLFWCACWIPQLPTPGLALTMNLLPPRCDTLDSD